MHTAKRPEPEIPEEIHSPDYAHYLPEPIQRFTTKGVYDTDDHQHLSFIQGGGHGGSHPHLVHEFISSLINKREPFPNAKQSPISLVWEYLHMSPPCRGGKQLKLPDFTFV
jgi:hypothetical protein